MTLSMASTKKVAVSSVLISLSQKRTLPELLGAACEASGGARRGDEVSKALATSGDRLYPVLSQGLHGRVCEIGGGLEEFGAWVTRSCGTDGL